MVKESWLLRKLTDKITIEDRKLDTKLKIEKAIAQTLMKRRIKKFEFIRWEALKFEEFCNERKEKKDKKYDNNEQKAVK